MKKFFVLLAVSLFSTNAFAQTEKGTVRLGAMSNLSFLNSKWKGADESSSQGNLGLDLGIFAADNFSFDLSLGFDYEKTGDTDAGVLGVGLGFRYYSSTKLFVGAGVDALIGEVNSSDNRINNAGVSNFGAGLNLTLGYAAFITDRFAIEPAFVYRFPLTKDAFNFRSVGAQIGFSYYF